MFSNTAVDVVLGLVFIYLLYSLLATILQEVVAQVFDLRARMLVKTIRVLLDDREGTNGKWFTRFARYLKDNIHHWSCPPDENKLSKTFYTHPTIKYLSQSSWNSKPSYISASSFSTTMLQILRGREYEGEEPQMDAIHRTLFEKKGSISHPHAGLSTFIDPETLDNLKQLYIDSQKDLERFQVLLERSFDETMERAGGWYKKQTQNILFFIGLLIAGVFNVDTIAISAMLSKDDVARENMVELAINSMPKYERLIQQQQTRNSADNNADTSLLRAANTNTTATNPTDTLFGAGTSQELKDAYQTVKSDIDKSGSILGLGWTENNINQKGFGSMVMGWLLTALAISMGAAFWFDMLNKVVQLRTSIAKPKDADTGGGSTKLNNNTGFSVNKRVG